MKNSATAKNRNEKPAVLTFWNHICGIIQMATANRGTIHRGKENYDIMINRFIGLQKSNTAGVKVF